MNDQDYEILLTLYETKNITKAARKLYLSQPTLSKKLKKIETELGTELFIRSKKGVLLTPLGESIVPYLQIISSNTKAMKEFVSSNQGYIGGTLTIGISINYSEYRLSEVLKQYTLNYPNVELKIKVDQSRNLYRMLNNNELSIALVRGDFQWDEGKIFLHEEPVCLVTSHENASRPINSYPYIKRYTDSAFYSMITKWMIENEISTENSKLRVDNIKTCLKLTKEGLGWCILPQICLDDFDGYIHPLYFQNGDPFTRSSYILYRHSYFELPQVKLFVNEILANEVTT